MAHCVTFSGIKLSASMFLITPHLDLIHFGITQHGIIFSGIRLHRMRSGF